MEENKTPCKCNEPITAFAFNTGRALEAFMNNYNNGLTAEFNLVQAKILDFYAKYKDADDFDAGPRIMRAFVTTFGIQAETVGNEQNKG